MNKLVQILVALGAVLAVRADAADLGEFFKEPQGWDVKAETFMGEFREQGFRFVDGQQTAMSSERARLRFLGLEVCEARVYFDPDAVRRVELSLYNI